MFKFTTSCRACGGTELVPVFSLGLQPLANSFRTHSEEQDGYAPLSVLYCPKCTLGQLSVVVKPEILYRDYKYVTSPSQTMQDHFQSIYKDIRSECDTLKWIVEIGSNDGACLEFFRYMTHADVFGYEPAENLAKIANDKNISTYNSFFSKKSISVISGFKKEVDLILARHVFCHVDDWKDFVEALEGIGYRDTLICIEVPYAVDTLARTEWDQCYHEHLSFLTIKAMAALLEGTKLRLHKILRYPIHGGSIMVMLRHRDYPGVHSSVEEFIASENVTAQTWTDFADRAECRIAALHGYVELLAFKEGKSVCGFGASAKCTVWMNACKIGEWVKFVTDTTAQKIGRFVPGTNVPVVDQSHLLLEQPDYAILFAWNFQREILEKQTEYRNRGGKFIIPIPQITIV